jgi:gliding motility-associated-like protein
VDNTVSPQDLIQNTLIQGCVEVSNISSPSNGTIVGLGSFGYFDRGSSNFPFQNGIVLTTGDANAAGNGQNNTILNDGDVSWGTDSDLENTLGVSGTLNATSISFDFISISNQIEFNYIFASEEYFGNFPCNFSDELAFLIREAGSTDPYTNIALVPDSSTPVNVNTVHDEIIGFCEAANDEFFEGYNVGDTNYNGRTTVLTARATIQPNVQYQIKLVIADQADENYDSAVFIEVNSFNPSVNLGEDFSTCATSVVLDGDIENPNANYSWFFNNAVIPSANQSTFNAIQSGNYRVEIEIPFTNTSCIIEDDINITLNSTQSSDPISDYNLCDDMSNDGIETFDLSLKDAEVLASVPPSDYTFSYHYSYSNAFNNSNAIIGPIQNTTNPQTIHVRIQDVNTGCLAFSTIKLNVYQSPTIVNPTPLVLCDDQAADGSTSIDLNALKDNEITNGQTDLVVTYHSTASDAASVTNALTMPYINTNANEQIFVSVTNPLTGCNSTTTLDLTVLEIPAINRSNLYIDACDANTSFDTFDLTSIIPEVLQGVTNVSVSFHTTQNEALTGSNPIANETNYQNISPNEQAVFIRVESNATGCASIARIEIHTNLLLTGTNIEDITVCDTDNDGTEEFDFESIALDIINDIPNVTVEFYESEANRTSQSNPINPAVLYNSQSNPQTIYLALESPTCSAEAEIELILNEIVNFNSIGSITTCDNDQDGLATINLSGFDNAVTNGQQGFSVRYFLTEDDANNNVNALPNSYTNTVNPFILFPRINFDETDCADVNSFEVRVLPAPLSEKPEDIIICDIDRDGFFRLNLNNSIPNSILSTPNRIVTFHKSRNNANSGSNPILNASNYDAQTEIVYMRVENSITGCHSVEELDIYINTLPYIGDLTNYINEYNFCEDETDGIGEFIFEIKDSEALDGQMGKEVSYYLSQEDAENKVNAIDKTSIYENISNPQEIYIRIDNITDESCYTTSSFMIEVGTNPEFNEPTNWFVCDDVSNDGSEIFDLSTKVTEVSAGISDIQNVTFYTSELDARNSTNAIALQFANTVNPQEIYVQIDNGTICNSITSFVINVIQVPDMTPVPPITECDDDFDGLVTFDLTIAEVNIIDVRQEDIVIAYYESFEDSESDSNPIIDPENFTSISNPQTVYIKVTNTVSNCYATYPIDLIINQPPIINDFVAYNACANENGVVDLTEINQVVTDVNFNILFSYFSNEADAIANINALDTNYSYITDNDTLFVRAEYSTTRCFDYYEFNLRINPLPIANQPSDLIDCDDDFDGLLEFDLLQQNSSILGSQNPDLFTISYHNSELRANENSSALATEYQAFDGEIIYARIENNTTGCYSITQFSTFVNPLPIIDIEDQVICLDNPPLLVSANTNNPTDQYLWSTGETSPEIGIFEIGSYSVTVTNAFNCESTSTFNVTESEAAIIDLVETVDFSDPNNITVTITGIGDYLYQLNNLNFQTSNIFQNVPIGYNTITIIDQNGCGQVTREVLVVDTPKHMTPNDDGDFDTWHIVGIETLPGTTIQIFDRFGKLLKNLDATTPGWDGVYNGNKMPAGDYWYVATVIQNGKAFEVKGHFALKR